jgi:nucleotide-binding universal stress UspA family protein
MDEEKAAQMLRRYSEHMLQPAIDLVKKTGISFVSEVLTGDIAKSIVESGDRHGCDGIVMGTSGHGAIGNLVMGSVATKVVHLTKLPVTLVK